MTIQEAIKAVIAGRDLSIEESIDVFTAIMNGGATDAQIAAFIVALRMKGESAEEITGAASVMRDKATHILPEKCDFLIDTCGTGGDGANTFNISSAAALVAAGAGATVAKHGNRSVSSKCGSADVLEALGVNIAASADVMKQCLDTVGIAFLFAPALHKAMKYAIGPRKEIGVRTIFNVLGPLTNPALAPQQLLGVFSEMLTDTMAAVLNNMGTRRAFVVYGMDGLDEISIAGPTKISEVCGGTVRSYSITPEEFGIPRSPSAAIAGGSPADNAEIIRSVLAGQDGPCRDIIALNAAFALVAAGIASDPKDGLTRAAKSIDSGAAQQKLARLIEVSNERVKSERNPNG
jgi:anthranilate phosphoribosyltransferase